MSTKEKFGKKTKKVIIIKTKAPRCIKCNKPMIRIYTKKSYKSEGKYHNFLDAVGYICNHVHYPYIIIDWEKELFGTKRMVDITDCDLFDLLEALKNLRIF